MCHVYISMQVPVFSHFISQLGISAVLFKSHIGPMPVGPIVGARYHTREPSLADTVGEFRFQRVIRTIARMKMCIDPVFLHLPCHNIDHASHSIRTVKYRGRPSQHLYALS